MPKLVVSTVFLVVALFILRWGYLALSGQQVPGFDFRCYYTAALMARNHQSKDVYLSVGDRDPLLDRDRIDSGTAFARTAAAHHVYADEVALYDYPPTLADLVVPFTFLEPSTALKAWFAMNMVALVWACVLLLRMPGLDLSGHFLPVLGFLLFPPTVCCLFYGQASILLFLFIVAAINLYAGHRIHSAAFLFALAIAIKLTPLVVVIPLLAWRDWKMLRAIAFWGMVILAALVIVNGWGSLDIYFFHVMPRIGSKFYIGNRSLASLLQVLWLRTQRGTSLPILGWIGKLIALLAFSYAGWNVRAKPALELNDKFKVRSIASFFLLSCSLAPVSWVHAYVLGAPALVIFGKHIWEGQSSVLESLAFLLLIVSLATNTLLPLVVLAPVMGLVLGLIGLRRLRCGDVRDEGPAKLLPVAS